MPKFFDLSINKNCEKIVLTGENAHHIGKVLRCRIGDSITVCDGKCTDFVCTISDISKDEVFLDVQKTEKCKEPSYEAVLYQALPKGDKTELIIQKAVELGVRRIVLFSSQNCVVKFDKKSVNSKLERYNAVSLSAAKQCLRGIVPKIEYLPDLDSVLEDISQYDKKILFYEGKNTVFIKSIIKDKMPKSIGFIIGSEGGFTPKEAEKCALKGLDLAGLGDRILRTETASLCALAMLMYEEN
ncbi:MAG: 16S rRNA (uracil(1498)-N(3))-methyltransferase [Ruminococcaceae bacterium]|nr:16S rRNA (uracil(1498)-N(3))-methyltransferase [Oscillospiraceae bacterium]